MIRWPLKWSAPLKPCDWSHTMSRDLLSCNRYPWLWSCLWLFYVVSILSCNVRFPPWIRMNFAERSWLTISTKSAVRSEPSSTTAELSWHMGKMLLIQSTNNNNSTTTSSLHHVCTVARFSQLQQQFPSFSCSSGNRLQCTPATLLKRKQLLSTLTAFRTLAKISSLALYINLKSRQCLF